MALKLLMMGTGTFALPTFQALVESGFEVVGLVTQPDRGGRGHHQHVNPLKELALSRNVPVFQPEKVNVEESLARLREFEADVFVVAAYGQILSSKLLQIPRLGAYNLHGSLLPKYRGAAPVQYAVWKGERETGVTIFKIEPKLDAGPMVGVVKTPIGEKETSGQLHDRLAELAVPLTLEVLELLQSETQTPVLQAAEDVTLAPRIKKEDGIINWSLSPDEIGYHVRAMQPWPMPVSFLQADAAKPPVRLQVLDVETVAGDQLESHSSSAAGTIFSSHGDVVVRVGGETAGFVKLVTVQPAGKRAMSIQDFARGANLSEAKFVEPPVAS